MNENAEASSSKGAPSPVVDFTAGVVAGVTGLVVGQPFDVVKVRYQTPAYNARYSGTFGALSAILREEGTRGLFKGVMSPMAGVAFINGVIFTSYSSLMNLQHSPTDDTEPSLAQIGLAGAGSGVIGAFIASPTELIKIRQQSAPSHLNPSTMSVIKDIIRKDGVVRGMYRGFSATALRDIAYGPYFVTYEATCRFFRSLKPAPEPSLLPELKRHPNHNNLIEEAEEELHALTWPELMTAGGLAGVTAWLATFPLDVFKTRMQAVNGSSGKRLSLWRVGTEAVRNEGWRVMFAGLGPTLIRAVPANMVIFLTFEGVVSAWS